MLTELVNRVYSVDTGENSRLTLRYDMKALLALEQRGHSYKDIFADEISGRALCDFLECGAAEKLPDTPVSLLSRFGAEKLWKYCREAMLLALPEYDPAIIELPTDPDKPPDFGRLRCLICDVMRKPEEFFWRSTLRELISRWQEYAEFKGYAKKPERMEMYDTEGMENA